MQSLGRSTYVLHAGRRAAPARKCGRADMSARAQIQRPSVRLRRIHGCLPPAAAAADIQAAATAPTAPPLLLRSLISKLYKYLPSLTSERHSTAIVFNARAWRHDGICPFGRRRTVDDRTYHATRQRRRPALENSRRRIFAS